MMTFTAPGFNLPSIPEGMIFPVPIRVIGTTGTPVFAATLNAPFYKSPQNNMINFREEVGSYEYLQVSHD